MSKNQLFKTKEQERTFLNLSDFNDMFDIIDYLVPLVKKFKIRYFLAKHYSLAVQDVYCFIH